MRKTGLHVKQLPSHSLQQQWHGQEPGGRFFNHTLQDYYHFGLTTTPNVKTCNVCSIANTSLIPKGTV